MKRTFALVCAALVALVVACGGSGGKHDPSPASAVTAAETPAAASDGCSPARAHAAGDFHESIASGGLTRTYILHIPASYDGASGTPVVLVFHGFATNADFIAGYTGFPALGDQQGFITVLPDGTGTPTRWYARTDPAGADDLGFVKDLLAKLDGSLCIDRSMTFAAGYSTGGGMAEAVACEMPDRIAAIGLVASTYVGCTADVPLVAFHGMSDPLVPFEGGPGAAEQGGGIFPPVRRSVSEWARASGCDALATITRPSSEVELSMFGRCPRGDGEVLLYTIIGGGHTWPGAIDLPAAIDGATTHEIDATSVLWDFFTAHRRG